MVVFGGNTAWKQQTVGDICRSFQLVEGEPAMVLFPKIPRTVEAGAYVICLSAAFKYDDVHYLVQQSAIAARVMGMDETKFTIHRIGTAIHDGLLDLIVMPPEPVWHKDMDKGGVIGDLEVKRDGKIILEREVRAGERGNVRG
jgi:hypothetical protein